MKTQEIDVIDEKEEKLIELLKQFDFDRATSNTLMYMLLKKTAVSSDIERAMDLRQPDVSNAAKQLRGLGILSKKDIKHKGKGRPNHQYTLKKSPDEIRAFIEKGARAKIKSMEDNLKTLDALMSGIKND